MQKSSMYKGLLFFSVLIAASVHAAITSRVTSFSDGSVLFASQLNSEFNNLLSGINSINNDQLATNAAIAPSKLSASIAGNGLSRNGTTGALSVSVDDSTVEISSNNLQVKDEGITNAKLADMEALTVKGNATNATAVPTNIAAGSDGYVLRRSGTTLGFGEIATAGITDSAVTFAKRLPRPYTTGAAAAGEIAVSSAHISQSLTTSLADLTNLTVTITTRGGPVQLQLVPDADNGGFSCANTTQLATRFFVAYVRGSTVLPTMAFTSTFIDSGTPVGATLNVAASSFSFMDFPAAGTYTYKVQAGKSNATGLTCSSASMRFIAHEL